MEEGGEIPVFPTISKCHQLILVVIQSQPDTLAFSQSLVTCQTLKEFSLSLLSISRHFSAAKNPWHFHFTSTSTIKPSDQKIKLYFLITATRVLAPGEVSSNWKHLAVVDHFPWWCTSCWGLSAKVYSRFLHFSFVLLISLSKLKYFFPIFHVSKVKKRFSKSIYLLPPGSSFSTMTK